MRKIMLLFCSLCTCIILTSCWFVSNSSANIELKSTFFNVGQGDACLLEMDSTRFLVDAGPDGTTLLKYLSERKINRLQGILISHQDLDHMGGLSLVLDSISIGHIYIGPDSGGPRFDSIAHKAQTKGIPIDTLYRGDTLRFAQAQIHILWPERNWNLQGNAASQVLMVQYEQSRILFTGDLEEAQEKQLLDWEPNLRAQVLKVAHHGSKSSTSLDFVARVNPYLAVISSGPNNYGHPDSTTLANLSHIIGTSGILRTDELGNIGIVLSPTGIQERPSLR